MNLSVQAFEGGYSFKGLFLLFAERRVYLNTRIALIGIIVEQLEASNEVNRVLHEYSEFIIGRMGLPYKERNISIISVVIDAEVNVINTISGKLGMIKGISVKTMYSKETH